MGTKMRNEQGSVNAENIQGTYDHEHELNKKVEGHQVTTKEEEAEHLEKEAVRQGRKIPGVNAENIGGTSAE